MKVLPPNTPIHLLMADTSLGALTVGTTKTQYSTPAAWFQLIVAVESVVLTVTPEGAAAGWPPAPPQPAINQALMANAVSHLNELKNIEGSTKTVLATTLAAPAKETNYQ
jgi:hypothetical protein